MIRSLRGFNPEKLRVAIAARMSELREIAESSDWQLVGRSVGFRDPVTGRIEEGARRVRGGWADEAPESPYGPARTAKVIRKGKGRAFEKLRRAVGVYVAELGWIKRERQKRPSVEPHTGNKKCIHCGMMHTKKQHKFHGPGAFHRTHVWGFAMNKNRPRRPFFRKRGNVENLEIPLLYGRVLRVEAQKTQVHRCDPECADFGHRYYHDFKTQVREFGLPRGTVITIPSGTTYTLPERALLLTTRIHQDKSRTYEGD